MNLRFNRDDSSLPDGHEEQKISPIHIVMYFHNDTRLFGEWMGTTLVEDTFSNSFLSSVDDKIFYHFKSKCIGEHLVVNFNKLTPHATEDGKIELNIQSPMNWYQKIDLDLHKTTRWKCTKTSHINCTTYWKERKLIVLMAYDDENPFETQKIQIREVNRDNPNEMILTVRWNDNIMQKFYHRVVYSELPYKDQDDLKRLDSTERYSSLSSDS